MDCGPTCVRMISKYYGITYKPEELRQKAKITREGVTIAGIAEAAESIGFETLAVKISFEVLKNDIPLPAVCYWKQRHFVVVHKITNKHVFVADPAFGLIRYERKDFLKSWESDKNDEDEKEGLVLAMEPTPAFYDAKEDLGKEDVKGLLQYLKPYLKSYKKTWRHVFLGLFLVSMIQMMFPFLTQAIVDRGINYQDLSFIYILLIGQVFLFISQTAIQIIRDWLLLYTTSKINIRLLSDFLTRLIALPLSFFDSKHVGDIIQRVQDFRRVQALISSNSLTTMFSLLNLLVFSFILAYYNTTILLIFLGGSAVYLAWAVFFLKKRAVLDYKRFDEAAGNQSSMVQLVNGMSAIKLNNSELRRRWEWEAIQIKLFKISIKSLSLAQTQSIGGVFINELKNIFITFIAAKSVIEGNLTLGMMLSVQYIVGQLNVPVNGFIGLMTTFQDAKLSIDRLNDINKEDTEENDQHIAELPNSLDLSLENVCFRYGDSSSPLILEDLSMKIPEGHMTAIVGVSGSGKTTLLKLLLKFYDLEKGAVKVGHQNLNKISPKFWRSKVGVVMQDGFIFSDTILRNITESDSNIGHYDSKRLREAVRIANIEEFVERLPNGLLTRIGSSGVSLSGGQRQRILIARAVYKNPKFLFFDEATSALDTNNERIIMDNLNEFYKNRTAIVIAHRLSTVKNADQIIVLDNGAIVEVGTHSDLVEKRGMYFHLVRSQLELGG